MSKGRGDVFRWALALSSTLISVALAELFVRAFFPAPYFGFLYVPPQRTFFEYDAQLGWRGRPHAEGAFSSVDFDVAVSLDDLGFRNETPIVVPGKKNWLLIGDSFGWGWGVENDQVISQSLMHLDPELNVYNLSAPGFGTDQEFLTTERFLADHPSDSYEGLILLFCKNDIQDVGSMNRYGYPKSMFVLKDGVLSLKNVPVPEAMRGKFENAEAPPGELSPSPWSRFHLYNLVTIAVPKWFESRLDEKEASAPAAPTRKDRRDLGTTKQLLGEIAALSREREMFFHVVLLMTESDEESAWYWDPLSEFMTKNQIDHSRFQSRLLPRSNLWLDGHLSATGNLQLARHLLNSIR